MLSVIAALAAFYVRLPGVPLLLSGVLLAAWMEPQPELTGSKGVPANSAEEARLARFGFWSDLRLGIFSPAAVSPGWPVRASFVVAVVCAAGGYGLPVFTGWARAADAACAFLLVSLVTEVRRRNANPEGDHPAVRVDALPRVHRAVLAAGGAVMAAVLAAGFMLHGEMAGLAGRRLPRKPGAAAWAEWWLGYRPEWQSWPLWLAVAAIALLAGLAVLGRPWCEAALSGWRSVVAARATWKPRWGQVKIDPAPQVIAVQALTHPSGATVTDTEFHCPPHLGFADFETMAPKLHPMTGQGTSVSLLPVRENGPEGPAPGSVHPSRFRVVVFTTPVPDVSERGTGGDWAGLFLEAAVRQAVGKLGYPRPVMTSCEQVPVEAPADDDPVTPPDSDPAPGLIWATQWAFPGDEVPLRALARESGALAATARTDAQVDATETGTVYFGALDEAPAELAAILGRRRTDDEWASRWSNVKSVQQQNPAYQHNTYRELELADGGVLCTVGFMTRQGQDPAHFRTATMEAALRPAMGASLTFLSSTAWSAGPKGGREGERHHGAFRLAWSMSKVPATPATLRPCPADRHVLAGMVNKAFDAARTPRPEVLGVRALASAGSRSQLWEARLRLFDGVTASQVRSALERMKTTLGAEWLRAEDAEEGCVLYAGDPPGEVELASPGRDGAHLTAVDWEEAWRNSGVKGAGGALPRLMGPVSSMPKNPAIKILDYQLPDGIEISEVREKKVRSKLGNQTGNGWVLVRAHPETVGAIRVLCAEKDPMPTMVPYDFEYGASLKSLPFADGEDGEPVAIDWTKIPHAMVVGLSGSGKSSASQCLVYGALTGGFQVVVIDPTKGGADFAFADSRLLYRAAKLPGKPEVETYRVAAAAMKAVYAEGQRRIGLCNEQGVGSYQELDDPPPPVLVFFDEFAGILSFEKGIPSKPYDDPELEAGRLERREVNDLKLYMALCTANIAAELRSAGIHLILSTQRLTAKLLDSVPKGDTLRTNLARCILGKATFGELQSALRNPMLAPEHGESVPKGRGIFEPLESGSVLIQGWFATQDQYREQLRARVPELGAGEKLDITPFLPKPDAGENLVGIARPVGGAAPAAAEEVEVEAVEVDDSFWDDDEDEDGQPGVGGSPERDESGEDPEVPAPTVLGPVIPIRGRDDRESVGDEGSGPAPAEAAAQEGPPIPAGIATLILLEPAGGLCPVPGDRGDRAAWPDWEPGPGGLYRAVSRTMLTRLGELATDGTALAWLPGTGGDANTAIAPHIGDGGPLPCLPGPDCEVTGWAKLDAIIAYLSSSPGTTRVCWIDGDFHPGAGGVRDPGTVRALLARLGIDALLVAVDPGTGVTPGQVGEVEEWAAMPLPEPGPHAPADEAEDDGIGRPLAAAGTVLVCEVDGVMRGPFGGEVSRELLRAVRDAEQNGKVRLAWLTSWGESVNVGIGRELGGDPREVIPVPGVESAYGEPKLDALEAWLAVSPDVKHVIWADPVAAEPAESGFGTVGDVASRIARENGAELAVADLSTGMLAPEGVRVLADTAPPGRFDGDHGRFALSRAPIGPSAGYAELRPQTRPSHQRITSSRSRRDLLLEGHCAAVAAFAGRARRPGRGGGKPVQSPVPGGSAPAASWLAMRLVQVRAG
jgi:hypothetical protein